MFLDLLVPETVCFRYPLSDKVIAEMRRFRTAAIPSDAGLIVLKVAASSFIAT
jgi:hypothetical protein